MAFFEQFRRGAWAVAALCLSSVPAPAQPAGGLFVDWPDAAAGPAGPGAAVGSASHVVRSRLVGVDPAALPPVDPAALGPRPVVAERMVRLNMFADAQFTGRVDSVAPAFSGGYSVAGTLDGVPGGRFVLVVDGGSVSGVVRAVSGTYRVRPSPGGPHVVSEVDEGLLPPAGVPVDVRPDAVPPPVPPMDSGLVAAPDPAAERAALEAFYDATGGPDWVDSTNWKTSAPLSEWYGVDVWNGTVVTLSLTGNGLSGPVPTAVRNLRNLAWFYVGSNELTGSVPAFLGEMPALRGLSLANNRLTGRLPSSLAARSPHWYWFDVSWNDLVVDAFPSWICGNADLKTLGFGGSGLTGPVPPCVRDLSALENFWLGENWGLTGGVPSGLLDTLESVWLPRSRLCVSAAGEARVRAAGEDWFAPVCGPEVRTVDVAVFYTPAARAAAGGTAAVESLVDVMAAEANDAYRAAGVRHRIELVHVSEVTYAEVGGEESPDLDRFAESDDGFMDGIHGLRDRAGADLAHLIFEWDEHGYGGRARYHAPFGLTCRSCGGLTFAHELGHNMGLKHDRYASVNAENVDGRSPVRDGPEHGFVDSAGAFRTVMAYGLACDDCPWLPVFSNPRLARSGHPLGVAYPAGRGLDGPADAAAVLDYAMPAVSMWRDRPADAPANQPPAVHGVGIPDAVCETPLGGQCAVHVPGGAFSDPDGDTLRLSALATARRDITPEYWHPGDFDPALAWSFDLAIEAYGTASFTATLSDPDGLEVRDGFIATVRRPETARPFTDDPLVIGVTPIRAVHFTELMDRVDLLRAAGGRPSYRWTDGGLPRPARDVRVDGRHLWRLWDALSPWCGPAPGLDVFRGEPVRAAHVESVRRAVLSVEAGRPCQG